jgi:Tol biopolymer transport system component
MAFYSAGSSHLGRVTRVVSLLALAGLVVAGAASAHDDAARNGAIAFQRGVGLSPTAQIWTVNPDGSGEHVLVHADTHGLVRPGWAPDGRRIAFLSDDRPGQLAYVAAADGKNQRLLPGSVTEVRGITWSPNGKQVAFSAIVGARAGLFVASLGSKKARFLARGLDTSIVAPAFSPLGNRIAYTVSDFDPATNLAHSTLWSIAPDGSHRRKLASLAASYGFGPEDIFSSTWSPDGRRIAAALATNRGSASRNGAQIVLMNADGTDLKTLTKTPGYNWCPAWSPDGRKIVFSSNRTGQFQLWMMNPDGSKQTRLTHDRSFDTAPGWQPVR